MDDPAQAEDWLQEAAAHLYANRLADVETCCRHAIALGLRQDEAYRLWGCAALLAGRVEAAVELLRHAVNLNDQRADTWENLRLALHRSGLFAEAEAAARTAIERAPGMAEAWNGLGIALRFQHRMDEAAAALRRAIELKPDLVSAHNNLGTVLQSQDRAEEAVACFKRAIELQPRYVMAWMNLGMARYQLGQLHAAVDALEHALGEAPASAEVWSNYGLVLMAQARTEAAWRAHDRAVKLAPERALLGSNMLMCMQYVWETNPEMLLEQHQAWATRHAAPLISTWRPHANSRVVDRPLRVGFVSGDLARHPVAYFLLPLVESLDPRACEIVCYSEREVEDDVSARIRARTVEWRPSVDISDEALARQIRHDRIDVLFDLAGHTTGNRLLVFARRPSPVQIGWIGYPGTTGMPSIDYLMADRFHVRPGEERFFSERLLFLSDGWVSFAPPTGAPEANSLPALTQGHVTFGSLNNLAKIGPHIIEWWSRILRRVAGSRLVLRYKGLSEPWVRKQFETMFAVHGVSADRLELLPGGTRAEALATYHQIDVALDPLPYSGGLTTCEALWMGVPVISLPGHTFCSRHSLSLLSQVGMGDCVAANAEDYVERAVAWAGDLQRLAATRAALREFMNQSPLCDGRRFAHNWHMQVRGAWRRWCLGDSP